MSARKQTPKFAKSAAGHSLATPSCSEEASEVALTEMLIEDNRAMREAGCELAEAAIRVVREYDGCHRLMLAVSKWTTAVANEGGRQKLYSQNVEMTREMGASPSR